MPNADYRKPVTWKRLLLGPNFILVLLLLGFMVYRYHDQFMAPFKQHHPPKTIEQIRKELKVNKPTPPSYLLEEPNYILEKKEELNMDNIQTKQISQLISEWEKNTRVLREQLKNEDNRMQKYLSQSSTRRSTESIQSQAKDYSDLSQQLAVQRNKTWSEITTVLSKEQLNKLNHLPTS